MPIVIPIVFTFIIFSSFIVFTFIAVTSAGKKTSQRVRQVKNIMAPVQQGVHDDRFSHDEMINYSEEYSNRNSSLDSGIKDKPMSEAERNVFYGK